MNRERLEILKELSDLLEKDRITKDEYEVEKKNLLRPTGWVWDFIQRLSFGFRAISPQIVILILVLLFYNPVKRLVNNASEVGFGDVFAVKVEQALRIGNPDLAKKVSSLSREELFTLLNSGAGSYGLSYKDDAKREISLANRFDYYVTLQQKGLVDSDEDLAEIGALLKSKKAIREETIYDSTLGSYGQKYYSLDLFSKEELIRIESLSASLSESGKLVYSLVVDVASDEITKLQ